MRAASEVFVETGALDLLASAGGVGNELEVAESLDNGAPSVTARSMHRDLER
jgi:hypothetical protein